MSEEKKLPFYLREKLAIEVHGESGGTATEDTNKMVLECLYGFFGHVASRGTSSYVISELPMAFLYAADAWFYILVCH